MKRATKRRRVAATKGKREDVMERLISLFREPGEEDGWPGSGRQEKSPLEQELGLASSEPLYFQDLLEYLREQNAEVAREEDEVCDA
jgi:hypothetical protein